MAFVAILLLPAAGYGFYKMFRTVAESDENDADEARRRASDTSQKKISDYSVADNSDSVISEVRPVTKDEEDTYTF